ncbi:uncharacterized protein LOC123713851 isoform X1 [Pieris brassicae]|uniref:uncharacterized protein LOC123713851 isoform X1 n=1 Tax=Pieris brassicae TaxID=7116 RepID=UPI001E661AC3|nr:uncharacterized protein LOC123713851 isoform X1 [Pieris brassicae]XP_045523694.1 uncharacterized protein LOC123713851 isoform X1 [Pieris brassicae]XP_045523695.1 uncharacterized protein LOC123713851 isoform X1 [Pieris brassicae]XP_045523696.1 uncharacterized protein LOC123713851 isoform X1 [Pieris brassicae]XP_045523697.1 uncharacterized protein LOC123713851 isoform X1 [Pieris brassicae]
MSAPSDSATSPPPCACTNISLMQLFHELKQKFPGVPDHVVSNTIELYCHDKKACETHLHREVKTSLTHAYHASSVAAARQLSGHKVNAPQKCRNQPIIKHEALKSTNAQLFTCQGPQKAIISTNASLDEEDVKVNTDANQNVVKVKTNELLNTCSPVTIVNLDNCFVKYSAESPSDLELSNENNSLENGKQESTNQEFNEQITNSEQPESTNFKLLKSNKIRSNLNERLEGVKEKKTIKRDKEESKVVLEKPQRPNTLNFIKPSPDIAFNDNLKQPEETCRTISPAPSIHKTDKEPKSSPFRQERGGYPLNLSVNVNCHMDLSRGYCDPWLEDYESPRAITSVNLTVCTPTSNMASPVRERNDDNGFEGHVTVTVSPSTTRPKRRAPPPPQSTRIDSPRPSRVAPEPPGTVSDRSLIERQKERLSRLAAALAQEKGQLAQLNRETQILAAPPPSPSAAARFKDHVERLRDECDMLAKRLEMGVRAPRVLPVPEADDNFYSNIYTGQRPSASWQCHMCTFRNHPLLDKCEECDMPRIFVGTSPATTHDSGFGSFRDRNRRGANLSSDTGSLPNIASGYAVNV